MKLEDIDMIKHRWKKSMNSLFDSHADHEKHEKLKETKIDMEEKKNRIIKLIKEGDQDETNGNLIDDSERGPLVELVENFHKEYESLYELYHNLTGELQKKVNGMADDGEKDTASSSSWDSDSDAGGDEGGKNGKLEVEFRREIGGRRQEPEAAKHEMAQLKKELKAKNGEKEAQYSTALARLEDSEKTIEDMKVEADRLNRERSELLVDREDLRVKLDNSSKLNAELSRGLEELVRENNILIMDKENAMKRFEEREKSLKEAKAMADGVKNEKENLQLGFESQKEEVFVLEQRLGFAKEELKNLRESQKAIEVDNKCLALKVSELTDELKQGKLTIEELISESGRLKENLTLQERKHSTLQEMHTDTAVTNEASAQIKALEEQANTSKIEVDSLRNQMRDLEEQLQSKSTEAMQWSNEASNLQTQISQSKVTLKEKDDQLSAFLKKLEDNENESLSEVESLTAQITNLTEDICRLRADNSKLQNQIISQSGEASAQVRELMDQVNASQQELKTVEMQKTEADLQLERKSHEISVLLIQMESLNEKLTSSSADQQRILEEKGSLTAQLKDLEQKAASLKNQKTELEAELNTKCHDTEQLGLEISRLKDKILVLETTVNELGNESSFLRRKLEDGENEAASKVMDLTEEINNVKLDLEAIQKVKSQLELQIEREKNESSERLSQLEAENIELKPRLEHNMRMLQEHEESFILLTEQYKQLEGQFEEAEENLKAAERKMENMAKEIIRATESKYEIVAELESTVEDLKRDLEVAGDQLNTALENTRTIEVKLRLSNQKLRVTEQLLTEMEESHKTAQQKFQEECRMLENKITLLAASNGVYHGMIKDISEGVNNSTHDLGIIIQKFEEDYKDFTCRVSVITDEIHDAKNWVTMENMVKEKQREEVTTLSEKLQSKEEEVQALSEKLEKLEVEGNKEKGEKGELIKNLGQLRKAVAELDATLKQKDERLSGLGEEKREAIRQLCLWIEHQRARYEELKAIVSKMTGSRQRAQ